LQQIAGRDTHGAGIPQVNVHLAFGFAAEQRGYVVKLKDLLSAATSRLPAISTSTGQHDEHRRQTVCFFIEPP